MSFEQYLEGFWSYILIFQYFGVFHEFPWFPSFRIWVEGSKWKPGNHQKSLFQFFFLKLYRICFCVSLSLFLSPVFVIPLFNCYFRDFRDFCDFRVFDLAFKYGCFYYYSLGNRVKFKTFNLLCNCLHLLF